MFGKSKELIKHVDDRAGHVVRHAVDASKIRDTFNWLPIGNFKMQIEQTIEWYIENEQWWRNVKQKSADYQKWMREQYGV